MPTFDALKIKCAVPELLAWYAVSKRQMAWRDEVSPYRTWISEIMLQQTRVEAARVYFDRWMAALPSVSAVAEADEELLAKLWQGLGYYSRVRNIKKAAVIIVRDYGGFLPRDVKSLRALPGIGAYTAGAIASIAFGLPEPAVDGNVVRVFSRYLGVYEDTSDEKGKKALAEAMRPAMPPDKCSDFTQAVMELGALVCIPGTPRCGECPLRTACAALRNGDAASLPVLPERKQKRVEKMTVAVLRDEEGNFLLRKRPAKGLLAGLWEFWHIEGKLDEVESKNALQAFSPGDLRSLGEYTHIFTHVRWDMAGYEATVRIPPPGFLRVSPSALAASYALPKAFGEFLKRAEKKEERA